MAEKNVYIVVKNICIYMMYYPNNENAVFFVRK